MTTINTESGVRFPEHPDTELTVSATFLRCGEQLQQVFIGLEPVIVIQPEYDAEEDQVTFVVTACDLDPEGLIRVLDVLRDSAEEMLKQQVEMGLKDEPVSDPETTA